MKKLIFTFCLAVLIGTSTIQSSSAGTKIMGVFNMLGQNYTGGSNTGQFSFGGGIGYGVMLGNTIGFDVSALYSIRKVKFDSGLTGSYNFITLPVRLLVGLGTSFYAQLGGYYSLGLSGDFDSSGVNKSDAGALFGLGLMFPPKGPLKFFIDVRWMLGLMSVESGGDMKWGGPQFQLGVAF